MFEDAEKKVTKKGFVTYWKDGVMIGRKCTKCGEDKPISEFRFMNKKKGTYKAECKNCSDLRLIEWKKNNIEKVRTKQKEWQDNNRQKVNEQNKKWKENNPENHKKWKENNPRYYDQYFRNNKQRYHERDKEYRNKRKDNNIKNITNMLYQTNLVLKRLDIKAYGCIYRITGPNNHFYIGQTVKPLEMRYHDSNVIKGWIEERKHCQNQKFIDELKEEGNFNIDIIDYGVCQYHLDKLEAHYINKYNSCNNGYNNREGNHKTNDGFEEFNKILEENGLKFVDGKLIEK